MDELPVTVVAFTDMEDIKIIKISVWIWEGSLKNLPQMRNYGQLKDVEERKLLFLEDMAPRKLLMAQWMAPQLLCMVNTN